MELSHNVMAASEQQGAAFKDSGSRAVRFVIRESFEPPLGSGGMTHADTEHQLLPVRWKVLLSLLVTSNIQTRKSESLEIHVTSLRVSLSVTQLPLRKNHNGENI